MSKVLVQTALFFALFFVLIPILVCIFSSGDSAPFLHESEDVDRALDEYFSSSDIVPSIDFQNDPSEQIPEGRLSRRRRNVGTSKGLNTNIDAGDLNISPFSSVLSGSTFNVNANQYRYPSEMPSSEILAHPQNAELLSKAITYMRLGPHAKVTPEAAAQHDLDAAHIVSSHMSAAVINHQRNSGASIFFMSVFLSLGLVILGMLSYLIFVYWNFHSLQNVEERMRTDLTARGRLLALRGPDRKKSGSDKAHEAAKAEYEALLAGMQSSPDFVEVQNETRASAPPANDHGPGQPPRSRMYPEQYIS